jgi:hypothetical protein
MKYPFTCEEHGEFEVSAPMIDGPPDVVACPICNEPAARIYSLQPEIWNTEGSSRDYFSQPVGRGQPMDKKEWLNKNWSEYYKQPPPPPDSIGTYDGVARPRQVVRKKKE